MMTECIKRLQSSSGDMISNLPQDAIESILTCLSLRDAARTSILCRGWRNKWRSLPYLKFDSQMFKGTTRTHEMLLIALFQPDVLSGLISSSPILEELTVGLPITLDSLIEISAPNLRKLSLFGRFASICFNNTPLLSKCYLSEYPGGGGVVVEGSYSNILQSLHNLTTIKDLTLNYYYIGDKSYSSSIPRKLTTTLDNLRVLTLGNISFCQLHEVSGILSLIRSSPNLGEINALVSWARSNDGGWDHIMRLFQVQELSEVKLYSLRVVRVIDISGTPPELSFIGLLLAISPKLETMIVRPDKGLALEKRLEILTKGLSFARLSPVAKVLVTYE